MSNLDSALEKQQKALNILKEMGTTECLQWIMETWHYDSQRFSDDISTAKRKEYDKLYDKYIYAHYNGHEYELIYENYHTCYACPDPFSCGDFRLMLYGEPVFGTSYYTN